MKTTIAIAVLALGLEAGLAADHPDLEKLQGRWECKKPQENVTLIMEIRNDKLTFRMEGSFSFVATADLKVERLGPFKVFTSRNIKAGASEDALQAIDEQFSHVYSIEQNTLYVTSNFEKERDRPPALDVYRKVPSAK